MTFIVNINGIYINALIKKNCNNMHLYEGGARYENGTPNQPSYFEIIYLPIVDKLIQTIGSILYRLAWV